MTLKWSSWSNFGTFSSQFLHNKPEKPPNFQSPVVCCVFLGWKWSKNVFNQWIQWVLLGMGWIRFMAKSIEEANMATVQHVRKCTMKKTCEKYWIFSVISWIIYDQNKG